MSRSVRVLLAGLAALPLAFMGLLLGAGSASATTGGCFIPELAASIFGSNSTGGFFDTVDLSSDSGHLRAECADFRKGCKDVVKQSTFCIESAISSITRGSWDECKDSGSVMDCQNGVDANDKSLRKSVRESEVRAKDICQLCYEDCLNGITSTAGSNCGEAL